MSYIELNLMQSGSRDFAYTCRETSRILVTPSLTPILVIPGPTYWWYFYEWLNLRIGLYPAQKGTRIDNSKAFKSIYWNTDGISNNYCETGPSRRLQIPILILLSEERWWLDSEESDFGHDNSVRNRSTRGVHWPASSLWWTTCRADYQLPESRKNVAVKSGSAASPSDEECKFNADGSKIKYRKMRNDLINQKPLRLMVTITRDNNH